MNTKKMENISRFFFFFSLYFFECKKKITFSYVDMHKNKEKKRDIWFEGEKWVSKNNRQQQVL